VAFGPGRHGSTPDRKRLTDQQALLLFRTVHQGSRRHTAADASTPSCVGVATGAVCRALSAWCPRTTPGR